MSRTKPVDVICQHLTDGTVIPMRIRVVDEEGERRVFNISAYKDLSGQGARTMPDGIYVSNDIMVFECHIVIQDQRKSLYLYYFPAKMQWAISIIS